MLKVLNKEVDLGEPTSFLDPCLLGLHSKTVWRKPRYCWQLPNHVWIQNFRRSNWKIPCSENLSVSSWSCDMEGHAQKCVERYCELAKKTTQQLYKVLTPCIRWSSFQRGRNEICRRIGVILAFVCVKLLVRLYVCHRVGPFWVQFGSILGPFWVHFGSILGPFWVHFGSILGPFWVHFGSILGPFWVHFGSIWGPFGVHLGSKNRYSDKNQYLHKNQWQDKNQCSDKNALQTRIPV